MIRFRKYFSMCMLEEKRDHTYSCPRDYSIVGVLFRASLKHFGPLQNTIVLKGLRRALNWTHLMHRESAPVSRTADVIFFLSGYSMRGISVVAEMWYVYTRHCNPSKFDTFLRRVSVRMVCYFLPKIPRGNVSIS